LPTISPVDSVIKIIGVGSGGWKIAQNSGQKIYFGNMSTTLGSTGSIASTHQRDCIELICITADAEWQAVNSLGNLDIL